MRKFLLIAACMATVGVANATILVFDPGVTLTHFTSNTNDGYSAGRGVFFQALGNNSISRAGFFNGFGAGDDFTMTLWSAASDGSNLHVSNLGSFNLTPGAVGDAWADGSFGGPVSITGGSFYYLEVTSQSAFDKNWFYNWDGPPVNISNTFMIIDGGLGNDLSNTVAPALRVDANVVPEPASMAVLALGMAAMAARRRRKAL